MYTFLCIRSYVYEQRSLNVVQWKGEKEQGIEERGVGIVKTVIVVIFSRLCFQAQKR